MASLRDRPVLIVDDSPVVRTVLSDMLSALGIETIHTAEDAASGLDTYHRVKPGLVFLDITMPEEPGTRVAGRILKADPRAKIVLVTAVSRDDDLVEAAIGQGVYAYIRKPVRLSDLEGLLARVKEEESRLGVRGSAAEGAPDTPGDH